MKLSVWGYLLLIFLNVQSCLKKSEKIKICAIQPRPNFSQLFFADNILLKITYLHKFIRRYPSCNIFLLSEQPLIKKLAPQRGLRTRRRSASRDPTRIAREALSYPTRFAREGPTLFATLGGETLTHRHTNIAIIYIYIRWPPSCLWDFVRPPSSIKSTAIIAFECLCEGL